MTESDMGGKRWASRGLVNMLIHDKEMKSYKSAAEIISGAQDVFSGCGNEITEKAALVDNERPVASAFELQKVLENARLEIAAHEAWQREVIEHLPKQDDSDGLCGPVRQAFAKSAEVRERLLEQVKAAFEKYFNSQA